jgi:hypothetical protein
MLIPDFSVSVVERRTTCILEPSLMLSASGLPLARRLAGAVQLWVVRELWHILDNSQLFLQRPNLLFNDPSADASAAARALQHWERLRQDTDLNGLRVFWLADSIAESCLPAGQDSALLHRFDYLSSMLDSVLPCEAPIQLAARDSVALAATLGGAKILTLLPNDNVPPSICSLLESGMRINRVPDHDKLMRIERQYLREVMVHADAASMFWNRLRLAVIHIEAPGAEQAPLPGTEEVETMSPWHGAHAWWYPL